MFEVQLKLLLHSCLDQLRGYNEMVKFDIEEALFLDSFLKSFLIFKMIQSLFCIFIKSTSSFKIDFEILLVTISFKL